MSARALSKRPQPKKNRNNLIVSGGSADDCSKRSEHNGVTPNYVQRERAPLLSGNTRRAMLCACALSVVVRTRGGMMWRIARAQRVQTAVALSLCPRANSWN